MVFWRIEQRLRQKDLCEKLGITTAHYSNIERGHSDPSYDLLLKFREIYKTEDTLGLFDKEENQNGDGNTCRNFREE